MPAYFPYPQSGLILNDHSSYRLETSSTGLSLYDNDQGSLLYTLAEPLLLAQGVADKSQRIHLAYLKAGGDLCYSIISPDGQCHNTILGKLDTKTNRFDRLFLFPLNQVIHIFYATSHRALPDVWRITHLFWNGQHWQSAQLGEVVHPHHPLYHILLDTKSNLHVLMLTYLGSRSALWTNFFNGSFHIWSKRQESLSIPREVVDMTALMTPGNVAYVFWAAKQPGSDKLEIGSASRQRTDDFMSTWQSEPNPLGNINGPWKGMGSLYTGGVIHILSYHEQATLLRQASPQRWAASASPSQPGSSLTLVKQENTLINYTSWLQESPHSSAPLFAALTGLPILEPRVANPASEQVTPNVGSGQPYLETEKTPEPPPLKPTAMEVPSTAALDPLELVPPISPTPPVAPAPSVAPSPTNTATPNVTPAPLATPLPTFTPPPLSAPAAHPLEVPVRELEAVTTSAPPPPASHQQPSPESEQVLPQPAAEIETELPKGDNLELLNSLLGGIRDISASVTDNLNSLEKRFEQLPHILEALIQKNEEALKKLHLLEDKLEELKTERELASNKKGLWDRWFT